MEARRLAWKRRAAPRACAAALAAGLVAGGRQAAAREPEAEASLEAQLYQVTSPFGQPVLRRRRYTHMLALKAYDIADTAKAGPQLSVAARLRLDADLGVEGAEIDPQRDPFVPGLEQAPIDLMYAYVQGDHFVDGLLGFRLGRQYVVDALGWWSFDGGLVRVTTPAFVRLELYGGFEQRGGLAMASTSRFEADGVYRGDRSGLDPNQWPAFLEQSRLAPAYGLAVETAGLGRVHARVGYRKVINRDRVLLLPFLDEMGELQHLSDSRVSTERVGAAVVTTPVDAVSATASGVYDLYVQRTTEHAASLDWLATPRLTLGAGYDYYFPTFDGDSIFNWFTLQPTTTWTARTSLAASRRFDASLSGGVRVFEATGDDGAEPDGADADHVDVLGSVGTAYRWPAGAATLRGMAQTGQRGRRTGVDFTTLQTFQNGVYDGKVILSLYDWEDGFRPERSATSFTYVVGAGYAPFRRTRVAIEWEHTMNRLVGQRFRVLALLNVMVLQ